MGWSIIFHIEQTIHHTKALCQDVVLKPREKVLLLLQTQTHPIYGPMWTLWWYEWYHFNCLGLSELDIDNIDHFYCNECLNRDAHLALTFKTTMQIPLLHCYCQEKAYGNMIECTRCRLWLHLDCTELTPQQSKRLRLFFSTCCIYKQVYQPPTCLQRSLWLRQGGIETNLQSQ